MRSSSINLWIGARCVNRVGIKGFCRSHDVSHRPRRRISALKTVLIASVLLSAIQCAVALPSFDPFADASANGGTTYTPGTPLVGQNNNTLFGPWYLRGGNFGTTQPTIAAGSLSHSNMPASTGHSVLFAPASSMSACMDINLASGHTNAVYASFLLKITDLAAVGTAAANNPFAAFGDDPSLAFSGNQIGRLGSRLLTKKVGDGYVLGISRSANAADFIYEPDEAAHSTNEVVFVVIGYDRPISTQQPTISLWVNPPFSSLGSNQPPAATVVASSGNTALNAGNARVFAILCQFATAPGGVIDDVRVAINDWKFVSGGDPAVLSQPANRSVPEGNHASFSVVGRGTPTLTYQWIKDGTTPLSNGGKISGATSATLTVSNINAGDLGTYAAFVTNGVGDFILSSSATLSFQTDPAITNQPQDFAGNFGSTATFQVTAAGTPPFFYQWHKDGGDLSDGGNISGSQSNVLAISNIAFPDGGSYSVTVTNSLGAVDSSVAVLTVADPYFTLHPVPQTTNAGGVVAFQVAAAGSGALTYQWLKNGNLVFDGGNYSGTSTPMLTISNVAGADEAIYSATVIGPFSNAVSGGALLTVLTPASVLIEPRPRTVLAGVKTAFVVGPGGSGPFAYQWQRDGADVPGATSAAYVITNAQTALAGNYRVVISNSFSSVTSSPAALNVSDSLSLAETNLVIIRVGDGAQTLTVNGSAIFLDQFTVEGAYVNTITIPDEGPTAMAAIGWDNINGVNSGSTTGTILNRSQDSRFMVVPGYNTNLNYGGNLMTSVATDVPKGIGLIDSFGQYTLAVSSTNPVFNGSYWRAAITDGTNNYWGSAGIAGTYYFGFDAPEALVQSTFVNSRSMRLFNGDIYCAEASNPTGVLKIDGMPPTNVTPTILFGGASGSYDLAVSPNGNLIYLTDQRNVGNNGGIQRWDFDGANWNLTYILNAGFGSLGPRYITADFSGANPVLYVTSNDASFDNNRLIKVVDAGLGSAGTPLAFAGANQTFRGIHFGPVPNTILPRPAISFTREGSNLILSWTGTFTLMLATNVAGPYVDVSGATSPYTNSVTTDAQRFFGLRQ